jgi:hypothetical protein
MSWYFKKYFNDHLCASYFKFQLAACIKAGINRYLGVFVLKIAAKISTKYARI